MGDAYQMKRCFHKIGYILEASFRVTLPVLSLGSGTGGSHQKQLLGMPEAPRVEQGHVALSNPSPLPFRGVPGDCSQPWDDRKVLLDLGPLMGSLDPGVDLLGGTGSVLPYLCLGGGFLKLACSGIHKGPAQGG